MARKSTVDKKAELLAQIAREEQEAKERRAKLLEEVRKVEKAEADKRKARLQAMASAIGKKIVAVNEELTDAQVAEVVAFVTSRFGSKTTQEPQESQESTQNSEALSESY